MDIKTFVTQRLGIDKAIVYTASSRLIQAAGGLVSILFVARFLSAEEQGFFYTFGSIVAIQIFFELGLNGIITQYVAHEASHLNIGTDQIDGEQKYRSRLSSLLRFSAKWYAFFGLILFVVLMAVGYIFFNSFSETTSTVSWQLPWLLLSLGTSLNLLVTPLLAYSEGLGKVKEVAKMRFIQQIIYLAVLWGGLLSGLKLMVIGVNSLMTVVVTLTLLLRSPLKKLLLSLWREMITEKISYKKEILPYQWKIALSWISGYFIFQLFNPVLFATQGAVVAGQMGMTLAALNGFQALTRSWMTTKVPLYSSLIAQKKFSELDSVFSRTLKQSVTINGFCLGMFFIVIFLIRHFEITIGGMDIGSRFLAYLPLIMMIGSMYINQYVNSWAIYLRCHKREPFLIFSIVQGILCCLSTVLLCKYYGVNGLTIGYFLITLASMPWAFSIYNNSRRLWHT